MVEFFPLFPPVTHLKVTMPDASKVLRSLSACKATSGVYTTYEHVLDCLESVSGTPNTYNAIRGDINLLLNWSWLVLGKDIVELTLKDMNSFIDFCNDPPNHLISTFSAGLLDKSKSDDQLIVVNEQWRPFVNRNHPRQYKRTEGSLKTQLSNLSFVFVYLEDIEYSFRNSAAVAMRRLTSSVKVALKHERREVGHKGMSALQVSHLLSTVERIAKENPDKYERSRLIIYLMLFCYPRISEVSARPAYSPVFGDFEMHRDLNDQVYYTYFIPNSKGGKTRKVICPPLLIDALLRYRKHRGLGDGFPLPDDHSPMFVRHRAATNGREKDIVDANLGISQIGELIQEVFELVADSLMAGGYPLDAELMRKLTPHSLRHTGIQIDLASGRNPRHVMLDAGHSSEQTLAIYESQRTASRYQSIDLKNKFLQRMLKPITLSS
ncbi:MULTISPECIES: site-specific integrase [Vibrio]|uniref:Site-specific integrase n=1 Tax=Vibrio tasmaniensis TaxID=212663 RepID=A0A2N7NCQ4_9VIBR|nr:site-specific integrase [Vibrio tasmaniensis]PMO89846.1 hypothetical protein BCT01_00775 [Vibrio tasmaniensis]PMP09982.1 hypothetical protein BCS92_02315 [Vibrio tasmaniensis]TKG32635.1 site-specific integrase [Vibrio tasmaniensis]TKG41681.1 site-specific integrase [Vibrio tasmaniensis]TKG52036.1 site-specific integrase [Vibrio tasmaniensis]